MLPPGEPGKEYLEISYNYTGVCKYLKIELKKKWGWGWEGQGRKEEREKKKGMQRSEKCKNERTLRLSLFQLNSFGSTDRI